MLELRPHHGICIGQFIGRGYSAEFVENMSQVISYLEDNENELIRLVCRTDVICRCCPHNKNETCHSSQKVLQYDQTCLSICGLSDMEEISWKAFKEVVKKSVMDKGKLKEVCTNCSWISICLENAGRNLMENTIINAMKAIIVYNRKVLILKRTQSNKIGGGTWEFVGGKLEFGEDLLSGLKREIMEETGLEVIVDKLLFATSFKTHDYRQVVIINYLCHSNTDQVTISSEHTNYLWADKKTLMKYLGKRMLQDLDENKILDQLDIE